MSDLSTLKKQSLLKELVHNLNFISAYLVGLLF